MAINCLDPGPSARARARPPGASREVTPWNRLDPESAHPAFESPGPAWPGPLPAQPLDLPLTLCSPPARGSPRVGPSFGRRQRSVRV
jgi:hypothetical protein